MLIIRRVEGLSMVPAYPHGKIIVAWRLSRPRVGDVVVVKHHQTQMLKRIDQLRDGQVYVLGDNPDESTDSRQFGWLPASAVMGVVIGSRRSNGQSVASPESD